MTDSVELVDKSMTLFKKVFREEKGEIGVWMTKEFRCSISEEHKPLKVRQKGENLEKEMTFKLLQSIFPAQRMAR